MRFDLRNLRKIDAAPSRSLSTFYRLDRPRRRGLWYRFDILDVVA